LRLPAFALVGALASVVHYGIAVTAMAQFGFRPLAGNACGYAPALALSYLGQSRLTFALRGAHPYAFARFAAISLGGFALNSMTYALLLRTTTLDYRWSLLLALAATASASYLMVSSWVFPRRELST
jgi:putative flippase GtrA